MPAARIDDVTRVRTAIDESIRLACVELPSATRFGSRALAADDRIEALGLLQQMHACAVRTEREYLSELIDLAMRQLNDMTDGEWVSARG